MLTMFKQAGEHAVAMTAAEVAAAAAAAAEINAIATMDTVTFREQLHLAMLSLGVVFGGLATAPICKPRWRGADSDLTQHAVVMSAAFSDLEITETNVFSVLSLIFWAHVLIVSVKVSSCC